MSTSSKYTYIQSKSDCFMDKKYLLGSYEKIISLMTPFIPIIEP